MIGMGEFRVVNIRHLISTAGEIDFVDLSDAVRSAVDNSGITNGLVHVFAPHATGILLLTENDEPLLKDIEELITQLVPKKKTYNHPSNAHAHLRSILFPPDKTLPIVDGSVEFGTWQSLFFVETDVYPRKRTILIQVVGT
jgi:secondary thiamine-phosphate synthase enzyme